MMARIEAPVLANQVLAAVSAIFTLGDEGGDPAANPCRWSSATRPAAASASCPTVRAAAVLDRVRRRWSRRRSALKTILLSGQRPGEVAHMRREHIVDGWWQMPGEPVPAIGWPGTKNGESHRVWLPAPVQAIIAELSDGRPPASSSPASAAVRPKLDGAMRDAARSSASSGRRHTICGGPTARTITALGFGRDAMNRIQNHKEGGIGSVYDRHQYAEENKRVMEAVAARIMALVEGRAG